MYMYDDVMYYYRVFPIGSHGLAPDTKFEPLLNICLLSICCPLQKMGNACIDCDTWTEVEWAWLWRLGYFI